VPEGCAQRAVADIERSIEPLIIEIATQQQAVEQIHRFPAYNAT